MKKLHFILTLVFVLNACHTRKHQGNEPGFTHVERLFFEQKPPGLIPEVIAPGIVATGEDYVGTVKFSPDMKEIYTAKQGGKYKNSTPVVIRYENNKWQDESVSDVGRIDHFSKDGKIVYWENKYRERTESGWSELKTMKAPFDDKFIMGISISDNKTIFFSHYETTGTKGEISYSRLIDGKYESSQKLSKEINNESPLGHPYVAPDESYLIWDAVRAEGYGDSDLYISFRHKDGSWGSAINLGPQINTELADSHPYVTPDGKYLTFWRGGHTVNEDGSFYVFGKPYWVAIKFIENLKPK